jgi:hypothetical protein
MCRVEGGLSFGNDALALCPIMSAEVAGFMTVVGELHSPVALAPSSFSRRIDHRG